MAASALAAVLISLESIRDAVLRSDDRLAKRDKRLVSEVAREVNAQSIILNRFPQCTIPTSSWSMRHSNLHAILDILDRDRPSNIVEFGSGISTLMIASWLDEKGTGRLTSFDHDESWAEITRAYVKRNGLDRYVDVVTVPLDHSDTFSGSVWYDLRGKSDALSKIDLLIVDGPPGGGKERRLARHPALPTVYPQLSASATVVLDDANRAGEQRIAESWCEMFPEFELRYAHSVTGLAVLERAKPKTFVAIDQNVGARGA